MKKLIVYGAPWCAYCHQLMRALDRASIEYDYRNTDEEGIKDEMLEKTDGSFLIPTVDFNGKVIQNPDTAATAEIIKSIQSEEK